MKFGDALSKYYDVNIFKNLANNKDNLQLEDVGWASICKICRKQVMLDTIEWSDPINPNFSVAINEVKKTLRELTYQELHNAEIDENNLPDTLRGKEWCQNELKHKSDNSDRTLLAEYLYIRKSFWQTTKEELKEFWIRKSIPFFLRCLRKLASFLFKLKLLTFLFSVSIEYGDDKVAPQFKISKNPTIEFPLFKLRVGKFLALFICFLCIFIYLIPNVFPLLSLKFIHQHIVIYHLFKRLYRLDVIILLSLFLLLSVITCIQHTIQKILLGLH